MRILFALIFHAGWLTFLLFGESGGDARKIVFSSKAFVAPLSYENFHTLMRSHRFFSRSLSSPIKENQKFSYLSHSLLKVPLFSRLFANDETLTPDEDLLSPSSEASDDSFPERMHTFPQPQTLPLSPPPDLPSMLLHNRIIYLGLPITASVTELIVTQLLYLNYEDAEKPIFMYINSPGNEAIDRRAASSSDTESFAICDVLHYVKPKVHTIAVGQAWGAAALILSYGSKGHRYALPNASILFRQPLRQAVGVVTDVNIRVTEAVTNHKTLVSLLSRSTGNSINQISKDFEKSKFFSVQEAVSYGLVDQVLSNEKEFKHLPSFLRQNRRFSQLANILPVIPSSQSPGAQSDLFLKNTRDS